MSLFFLIFFNVISLLVILGLNDKKYLEQIKIITLCTSVLSFFLVLYGWWKYDYSIQSFQYFFNITDLLYFGCDSLSLSFLLLTTFLFPIFILVGWFNSDTHMKILCSILLSIELLLILVFSVLDLFGFYIFFELLLLPMIYLIAIWGADERKDFAILYFFLYTLFGSLCMLLGLILIYYEFGTTNLQTLYEFVIPLEKQKILWWLFFIPLAIKIPMVPGHLWLLEAHPEAPTIGSMILAGLLLKLGTYGFVRILIMLFTHATDYYRSVVITMSLVGLIYTSFILLLQYDIKRIIAYSSVAHMNYGLLGLFSESIEGVSGALVLMISHGFTASGLFLLAGLLYDRFHDRIIYNYSGLIRIMPFMAGCFFLIILSNFGFPGSLNFIGEILILFGIFETANIIALLSCFGLFLSLIYSILLFNRLFFGELVIGSFAKFNIEKQRQYGKLKLGYSLDLLPRELYMLFPLILSIIVLGIYPNSLLLILDDVLYYILLLIENP
jgi:proton-translocating NADH-quinone oxidoreductase chain M